MKSSNYFKNGVENVFFVLKFVFSTSPMYVILVLFLSIINSIYSIFNIVIIKNIVDSIQTKDISKFYLYILIMLSIGFLSTLINSNLSSFIFPKLLNNIRLKVLTNIFRRYLLYEFELIQDKKFYDLYFYVLENSENTVISTIDTLSELFTSFFTIIGVVYIFVYYDFRIIIYVVLLILLSFISSMKTEKLQYDFFISTTEYRRKIDYIRRIFYFSDYIKELKVNNTNLFFESLKVSFFDIKKSINNWGKKIALFSFFSSFFIIVLTTLIIVFLGNKVINGEITIAIFSMLYTGSQKLSNSFFQLFNLLKTLYINILNIVKYREFIRDKEDITINQRNEIEVNNENIKSIKLQNVSYKYDDKYILKSISAEFKSGNINFIVGNNGSGKSTLANIIGLVLNCNDGIIYYNNMELNEYTKNFLISKVSIVYQDFKLYDYSIVQNISMQYYNNNSNDFTNILKKVGMYDKIVKLNKGIYSELSKGYVDDGTFFSTGELQKLSLCRALYRNYDILILDEITSYLDIPSKDNIMKLLRSISKDKIVIMITHDFSLIRDTDNIFKLNSD